MAAVFRQDGDHGVPCGPRFVEFDDEVVDADLGDTDPTGRRAAGDAQWGLKGGMVGTQFIHAVVEVLGVEHGVLASDGSHGTAGSFLWGRWIMD